jgi:hypothetical protein
MNKSESIVKLAEALCGFQSEIQNVPFNETNAFLNSRYASLGALIEASRPLLTKYGLVVSQFPTGFDNSVGIETILMHKSGEWISDIVTMELGAEKGKSNAQVAGSAISYLRRYALAGVLGIYSDEDTDGNKPVGKQEWKAAPVKAKTELQAETPFTLADALHHENSEGVPYGEITTNKLAIMWNAMAKSIEKNHLEGDEKSKLERKMKAARMIIDARKTGEIAEIAK